MTEPRTDGDALRELVAQLAACQRAIVDLGLDIQAEQSAAHDASSGIVAPPQTAWRHHLADMVTALAALRSLAEDEGMSPPAGGVGTS